MATGRMVARESLTLAGVELLPLIFTDCIVAITRHSGDRLDDGGEIAVVHGPARALLTGERTALNFVQRLSGIATLAPPTFAPWKGRAAGFWILARPRRGCGGWRRWRRPRAAR